MKPVCLTVYAGPPRGGCYERMQRLVRALLERGWTIHFVGPVPPVPAHPSLEFHPVAAADGPVSLATMARCAATATGVCLGWHVRYVWTFGAAYAAVLAPLRLLPGRRMATFLRGSLGEQERARGNGALRSALAGMAEHVAVAASDAVVAVSSDLARRAGGKAIVLPNDAPVAGGVARVEDARRDLSLPQGVFLVGYAGSVTPIKSLETLVRAVALVPDAHLAIQGFSRTDTPYERSLRDLAAQAGLGSRAHLLPWAPSARALLAALDVVVVPSRHEGCSNILLEAMALGRPCLGARSGGIAEMLVDEALLFPAGDSQRLAERLSELRAEPRERERLASLARARAAEYVFDWDGRATAILEAAFRER